MLHCQDIKNSSSFDVFASPINMAIMVNFAWPKTAYDMAELVLERNIFQYYQKLVPDFRPEYIFSSSPDRMSGRNDVTWKEKSLYGTCSLASNRTS